MTEYGYDADRNITSQKTVMTGMPEHGIKGLPAIPKTGMDPVTMVDNTYTYDGNANRITKNTLSGKTGFGYDSANRLVRADYPQFSEEYRYDRAGNRTSRHRTGRGSLERSEETYKYDECNRLTVHDITGFRDDGTQESIRRLYTYDMQGNMLSDGNRQYSYDVRNRLAEVRTADGSWQKNHYDGEGLRAELEENGRLVRFIYDGDKAVLEGTDENTIRHIRGYELVSSDSEAAKTYYHYASDELGSITHVTDEDGNVLNRYEYDAFGNFTLKEETVENRFGFAGEQYDPAANLYYLRARFYNPVIGRFIQEDTYYGDGLNLYTYCHNNPVGYIDPSGNKTKNCPNKQAAIDHLKEQGLSEKEAIEKYDEVRKGSDSAEEARKRITGEYTDPGDRTRLPRNNGHWEGNAGNGIWHSDIEEVNAITGGKGIPFKDGRPDFSEWSRGEIKFNIGELNGTRLDFDAVYEKIMKSSNGKFNSKNAVKEWLRDKGLTPHHYSDTVIQLIPTDLHGNIPHIGSASDMRRSN